MERGNSSAYAMTTTTEPYLAAAVQMQSGPDKAANLAAAARLITEAAARGARLVALPELFNCLGAFATVVAEAETIPGPTSRLLGELADAASDRPDCGEHRGA